MTDEEKGLSELRNSSAGRQEVLYSLRLDDRASEYIDSRLFFERKPWMNVVVAVLLLLAVGNIVLTVVCGNTHYVWVPFLCAVWFVLDVSSFVIQPAPMSSFTFPSDIEITPIP